MAEVFVSYRREHWGEAVQRFARELESALRDQGIRYSVFIDVEIQKGTVWAESIGRKIRTAELVVVCLEQGFWRSRYCVTEIVEVLERVDRGETVQIIPVMLSPIDTSDLAPDYSRLYQRIRAFQNVDAKEGLADNAVRERVIEACVRRLKTSSTTVSLEQRARSKLSQLTRDIFDVDEIRRLLWTHAELRSIARRVRWDSSFDSLANDLSNYAAEDPEKGLRLLYAMRRDKRDSIDLITAAIEIWRAYEEEFVARGAKDIESLLNDILVGIFENSKDHRGPELPNFPSPPDSSDPTNVRTSVWARLIISRNLLILPFLEWLGSTARDVGRGQELSKKLSQLKERSSMPGYRTRAVELLLDLAGDDPRLLRSRLRSSPAGLSVEHIPPCSPWELARSFVELADLSGSMNETFFAWLTLYAHGRMIDLRAVAAEWGVVAGDPSGRFWQDHTVILLDQAMAQPDLDHFFERDWVVPRTLLLEQGAAGEVLARHVVSLCIETRIPVRSMLTTVERLRPELGPRIREVERILLAEEHESSSLLRLGEDGFDLANHNENTLVSFLVESYSSEGLRRLPTRVINDTTWLPTFPVTRGAVASSIVKTMVGYGLMARLVSCMCADHPTKSNTIRILAEPYLEPSGPAG